MPGSLLPNPEQVCVAWLKANVDYLENKVATEVPTDESGWRDKGFVVVTAVGGGVGKNGVRSTVLSLRYLSALSSSGRVARNRAMQLAEQVREIVEPTGKAYGTTRAGYAIQLPSQYRDAKVLNVYWTSEPRQLPGDIGDRAVYQNEIQLDWVVV